jgi:hypothetical protein
MTNVLVAVCDRPEVPAWQQDFMVHVLPAVEAVAKIRFSRLPIGEQEEGLAEATATAMLAFVRLLKRGKDPIVFAGRLAKLAVLRVLAGRLAGSPDNCQDVLSRLARHRHGHHLESLETESRLNGVDWESALVENGRITPADLAASRIDFSEWLARMKHRHRQIAETLAAGYHTEEVAELFQLSPGRVSQLRREFESSWRQFQREPSRTTTELRPVAA